MKILKGAALACLTVWLSFNHLSAQKRYAASAGEIIFSLGIVGTDSTDLSPVLRFSPVFNVQQQFHLDVNDHMGFYTGFGVRNVGLISHYTDVLGNTVKIKERSYSLGVPFALKFGQLKEGSHFAIGAEAELMFAYKRKILGEGDKIKYTRWFSDSVNIFNPSVFAELKFHKGVYIRFRYYLQDFLKYHGLTLPDGERLADYGPESPLFYVSIGTVRLEKKPEKKKEETASPAQTAFFKSNRKSPVKNSDLTIY